ncbi:nucleoside hydrolase [Phenylobacterium sp.]|uniref:nucleoside hydrolase n=1 Tax=Phenylobacterium sp. TaxID=1871053 RepID=UPI0025DE1E69|nr:nucleoside hydrolase [Phenylobacterium sp.]MCA6287183.1 nucleoside hydrolase [Phenylobacterium sp.]MCA6289545.1 nucleoside hydrolase [Phenylobacterium sp.]MCA6309665.1 nucleoside hydrolase [Phenylobacterium sp.]MCA6323606.1 nucleoside hydrolase [Phenylobacterium sp.]MCA6336225.1 nucleoside hydrolase [Phenylobacterium sp.]
MPGLPLIIDCDPGVDDALALLLALAAPEALEVLAITTVAGNVGGDLTARNAGLIRDLAGRPDIPVFAGLDRPLLRATVAADHFHGATGLGDLPVSTPARGPEPEPAVDHLVRVLRARPVGEVTLALLGPMTNLAEAIRRAPDIAPRIRQVVAMGGARREGGNITASAEFNIHADPDAADIVARSGVKLVLLGLDLTHQVLATEARRARLSGLQSPQAAAARQLLDFSARTEAEIGMGGPPPMHDPCIILWLLAPGLFRLRACHLAIETRSPLTLGHTAVEFRTGERHPQNALWGIEADADGAFDLVCDLLGRYG